MLWEGAEMRLDRGDVAPEIELPDDEGEGGGCRSNGVTQLC